MNERELRSLKRTELLELLLAQSREIEQLRARLTVAEQQLADRRIALSKAGSIAEASLALTDIFAEAQKAVDSYMRSVTKGALGFDDLRDGASPYASPSASQQFDAQSSATTRIVDDRPMPTIDPKAGPWFADAPAAPATAPAASPATAPAPAAAANPAAETPAMWESAVGRAAAALGVSTTEFMPASQLIAGEDPFAAPAPGASGSLPVVDAFEQDLFGSAPAARGGGNTASAGDKRWGE